MSIFLRIIAVFLALGNFLGLLMFPTNHDLTHWVPPAFLFLLSVSKTIYVRRAWGLALIGAFACTFSYLRIGVPFLRDFNEPDVEFLFMLQLLLILYFLIASFPLRAWLEEIRNIK
jgi:hypothetical protein